MPARTKRSGRLAKRKLGKSRFKFGRSLFLLLTILLVLLGLCFVILFKTSFWGRGERLGLTYIDPTGDIAVSNFDPKLMTISTIIVPKDTEVEVSRSLGKWRIGALLQLGENEKLGGVLLSETSTRYLKMPTEAWASRDVSLTSWFSDLSTNLSISDRVSISVFSLVVRSGAKTTINSAEARYLKKAKLSDGKMGYIRAQDSLPFELSTIFADPDIALEGQKIEIENRTGNKGVAAKLGEIVEVMGGKIFSVEAGEKDNSDCTIYGKSSITRNRIAKIFSCKTSEKSKEQGNFDLIIQIGTDFARRY